MNSAELAGRQVQELGDSVEARVRLAMEFYRVGSGKCRRFGRAELSFLRWEIGRGVLNAQDHERPGSRWWRAINDRLLSDKAEARLLHDAASGHPSSRGVELWREFIARPSPATWYLAHNASIVAGYIAHEALALAELPLERFIMNVALARVLFAHFMAAHPRRALGLMAPLARFLADPCGGSVQMFVDLRRSVPDRYPLSGLDVHRLAAAESWLPRAMDFGVIVPRLAELYSFSAIALDQPRLTELICDGVPCYAYPANASLWHNENAARFLPRLAAFITGTSALRRANQKRR